MLHFFAKAPSALGLDISGSSLKVMELVRVSRGVKIKGFAQSSFAKGLVINDVIVDTKTFSFLLKTALERPKFGKIDTREAVLSLPESKSFVRVIQIPKMSDQEAQNAVPFEAESFIPLPIDQVYLDWQKLGQTQDKMNILIIASPKEFVDKYLNVLDSANIKTVALEVESQSCRRAVVDKNSDETVLIVDLDAYRSSLIMVEEGVLQFTSTIPIAGNTFTETIARALGVSSAKAEEIKKKVGIANTTDYPNIKTALVPLLNNLISEIKNILKFHQDHSEKKVSKILLVGGMAKTKNLVDYLSPQFSDFGNLRVELANPWQNLPNLLNPSVINPLDSLGYATVIGLSMRGINLI